MPTPKSKTKAKPTLRDKGKENLPPKNENDNKTRKRSESVEASAHDMTDENVKKFAKKMKNPEAGTIHSAKIQYDLTMYFKKRADNFREDQKLRYRNPLRDIKTHSIKRGRH